MKGICRNFLIFVLSGSCFAIASGEPSASPHGSFSWPGEVIDQWHGFKRHSFQVNGVKAWVVEPNKAAAGNPWTWCMIFPDAYPDRTGIIKLLEKGFFHVHLEIGNTFGCPTALKQCDDFYKALTQNGLAQKGTLIGISRGGLPAYDWATQNPEKVICLYGDAPVCDFKSWPGGKPLGQGEGKGSPPDWRALLKCYGFKNDAEALAWKGNPVDNLRPLALAHIPVIHVVGDADDTVPVKENTSLVEQRYKQLGGNITVIHKPGAGHHPHGLDDPEPVVDFIVKSQASTTSRN